jgi:hypothetical protein
MTTFAQRPEAVEQRMVCLEITPEMAARWLSRNSKNRRLNPLAINRIAQEIQVGLFRERTGSTIIIDSDGNLQDGQHRLAAIVKTGISLRLWVLFGADPDDFQVIDTGGAGRRSDGQILTMNGVANANGLRAAAHSYLRMRDYQNELWTGSMIAPAIVREFVLVNQTDLSSAFSAGKRVEHSTGLPRSQFGAVAFAVSKCSTFTTRLWDEWVNQLCEGIMLPADSTALLLDRWSTNNRAAYSSPLAQQRVISVISKAWNLHAEGRGAKLLSWKPSELPMPLPVPSPY